MGTFIFDTTGLVPIVKFEELGAYFDHPISGHVLSDYFDVVEIQNSQTIQNSINNGEIVVYDELGNLITNLDYFGESTPIIDIDVIGVSSSYIGYGELNNCKISLVETLIDGTYTVKWADGNQLFNKIWVNRNLYSYF